MGHTSYTHLEGLTASGSVAMRWKAVDLGLAAPGRDSGSFKPGGFGVAYVNNGTLR